MVVGDLGTHPQSRVVIEHLAIVPGEGVAHTKDPGTPGVEKALEADDVKIDKAQR